MHSSDHVFQRTVDQTLDFLVDDIIAQVPNGMTLPVVSGWSIVVEVTDQARNTSADGATWVYRARKPGTSMMHGNGLLHEALYGNWAG